jgi:4'-phosphopantetheinyl transferase
LGSLNIVHQLDTRPQCLDAPELQLSFSSSGLTVVACASTQYSVGVDIEMQRSIENVAPLAQRFFTADEASFIEKLPNADQNIAFLKHWTAKEAGLKAIGKGIVSGLNSFILKPHKSSYYIDMIAKCDFDRSWQLDYINISPQHIVAIVHNSEK